MKVPPFSHHDLEVKQQFLELARRYMNKPTTDDNEADLANELAAALLYMNIADYMAEYLVSGLNQIAKDAVNRYYFGAISVRPPKGERFNIGESIKFIGRFDFPKKAEVIEELVAINAARKSVAHEILKTRAEDLEQIDDAVRNLATHTEELVELVDTITPGMPPNNILERYGGAES